jgi:hypothetical protein
LSLSAVARAIEATTSAKPPRSESRTSCARANGPGMASVRKSGTSRGTRSLRPPQAAPSSIITQPDLMLARVSRAMMTSASARSSLSSSSKGVPGEMP